jgi:hypothetical protein
MRHGCINDWLNPSSVKDSGLNELRSMIRYRLWVVCLAGLISFGCAAPSTQKTADLSAPPAPRMQWARNKQTADKAGEPRPQDLVIREHRFVSHSAELNLDGEDQVQRIANALRGTLAKITIEPSNGTPALTAAMSETATESSKLDLQRRQYVIQKLLSLGIPDAEERVVLESIQ